MHRGWCPALYLIMTSYRIHPVSEKYNVRYSVDPGMEAHIAVSLPQHIYFGILFALVCGDRTEEVHSWNMESCTVEILKSDHLEIVVPLL